MEEQIKALLSQVKILEEEANKHSGNERTELFKAAGRIKNQVATLLNQQGKSEVHAESKIPDPNEYFGGKLPDGFGNYFSGDLLTPEQVGYFDNLTPEQRDYFEVKIPDNVPDAPKQQQQPKVTDFDKDYRKRVFNALGLPCYY
ncbi:hypothetical protein EJP52_08740 [Escherichia coli]|nr:hypothetical protein [Escherichia coli]EFH4799019.1 hypothetical protein [Escherichia coli]EHN2783039.1 hypothetical protein [Escherichia coli]